jgi:DNA modification methylase
MEAGDTSSDEGDLVGDFYLGSGTSAVVCSELNRKFVGCDINQRSIDITKLRLKKATIN